LRVLL